MGNDNKIAVFQMDEDKTHRDVQLFLGDELKTIDYSKAAAYNLEKEYAKTKNNRDKTVIVILAVCFVSVFLLTLGLTLFIRASNKNIKVNINTFDDLNLKALLNSAGRTEAMYEAALRSKENLVMQREDELKEAAQKRDNDLYTIRSYSKVSSAADIAAKTENANLEYKAALVKIGEKYDKRIEEMDAEISAYENNLSAFDKERLLKAQESEAALDSQKQLNDMERKALEKRYQDRITDLKTQMSLQQRKAMEQQRKAVEEVARVYQAKINLLDPDARSQSEQQDKIILSAGIPKAVSSLRNEFTESFDGLSYTKEFTEPSASFVSSVKKTEEFFADLNIIAGRFQSIPLENSIRDYIPAMQSITHNIAVNMAEGQKGMQKEISGLKDDVKSKNEKINKYENYFESLCSGDRNNLHDGVVVECADKSRILVYISKRSESLFDKQESLEAQLRDSRKVICEVTVFKAENEYYAQPKADTKQNMISLIGNGQFINLIPAGTKR